ncbi:MAG: hypothetical protein R3320_14680 [Nitriliruptorales bacterium]|nr:hypothetical protein [Nitriliruptorales bacterium]
MGENATETLSEIEASRQRLQQDIDLLQARLPQGDDLTQQAKVAGGVAAAATVGLVLAYIGSKRALKNRRRHKEAQRQADALVDVLAERDVQLGSRVVEQPVIEFPTRSDDTVSIAALAAALTALVMTIVQFVSRRKD